jgi:hypothetical protein
MQHLINFRMKSTIVYKTVNFQMPVESLCQLWFIQTFFYLNEEDSDYIVTKNIYFRDFLSFQFPRMRNSTIFENLGLKIVNIWKNQLKTWNTCQNMSSQHTLLSNLKHWLQFCRRFRTYSYPIIFHGLFFCLGIFVEILHLLQQIVIYDLKCLSEVVIYKESWMNQMKMYLQTFYMPFYATFIGLLYSFCLRGTVLKSLTMKWRYRNQQWCITKLFSS